MITRVDTLVSFYFLKTIFYTIYPNSCQTYPICGDLEVVVLILGENGIEIESVFFEIISSTGR